MTTLPFDFDIFLRSGSSTQPEIAAFFHGSEPCSYSARSIVEKSQVLMMSCAWGRTSIGNTRAKRSGILDPPAGNLRRERRGRPGVHDVGVAGEPARPIALVGGVAVGNVGRRVDRQAILGGQEPGVVVDGSVLAHAIPDRERHAEEALAADAPVAGEAVDPVLEPRLHVRRMPAELAAAGEQRLARVHRLDEPLAAGHDLERPVALLVELHGVRDRTGLAEEVAALAEELDRAHAGLGRREPGELIVGLLRARRIGRLPDPFAPRHRLERAVRLDHRAHRQGPARATTRRR